ncbi:protoporphyrinogen/coproporphyrinogen oxidase [Streptomyces virginiae]|uniref:protoporphyrinogen/coproporphyrinogen oxidase n=1 Tax=Streptomyces virginiae TaxID=1961 RepID=UPI0038239DB2
MSTPSHQGRVIVVGAGIAGLAAGYRLHTQGFDVTVLEKADFLGGRMRTIHHGGYTLDLCAVYLSDSYRHMRELVAETGIEGQTRPASDRVGVLREGHTHYLSLSSKTALATTRLLTWTSKLKALRLALDVTRAGKHLNWGDATAAAALDTESAHAYAQRRVGEEIHDYLLDALCAHHFGRSTRDTSKAAAFYVVNALLGHGGFNFTDGIDTLAHALARPLTVHTQAHVHQVEEHPDRVHVTWNSADGTEHVADAAACVVAVPAPAAQAMLPQLTPAQKTYLSGITYAPLLPIYLGLHQPPSEDAFATFVSGNEDPHLIAVTYGHNIAPTRTPADKALAGLYFRDNWTTPRWNLDDTTLADQALTQLAHLMPDLAKHCRTHLDMTYVHRAAEAVVTREPGSLGQLADFTRSLAPRSRIALAGDYLSFSTTNAALATGEHAATRIHALGLLPTTAST